MKVRQYSRRGVYIRTYESMAEAARAVKTDQSCVSKAVKLDIKSKGYYWRSAEEDKKLKIRIRNYRRGGKHLLIFKKGKFLCETSTMSEAEDITGIPESTIRNSCKGKIITNKLYSFKYKEENTSPP